MASGRKWEHQKKNCTRVDFIQALRKQTKQRERAVVGSRVAVSQEQLQQQQHETD